jgi:hypothetical protein
MQGREDYSDGSKTASVRDEGLQGGETRRIEAEVREKGPASWTTRKEADRKTRGKLVTAERKMVRWRMVMREAVRGAVARAGRLGGHLKENGGRHLDFQGAERRFVGLVRDEWVCVGGPSAGRWNCM